MNYNQTLLLRIFIPFIISYDLIKYVIVNSTNYSSFILLKLIENNTFLIDGFIIFKETYVKLITACAAPSAYFLLLLLIVFTKDMKLIKGIKIFFFGSLILFVFNLVRIISLVLILDKYSFAAFNALHLVLWTFLSSLLVALIWIYFTKHYKIHSIPVYSDLKKLIKLIKKTH